MAKVMGMGVDMDRYLHQVLAFPGHVAVALVVILLGLELMLLSPFAILVSGLWRLSRLKLTPAGLKASVSPYAPARAS